MASLNKVTLIGNLGSDPELKYTPSGRAVANFNIATNEQWKDKDGQQQSRTEWHRIVVWGRQAEIAKDFLRKGKQIYLEGRLQTRSYDDKDGNKRYITEIVSDRFLMLGRRDEDSMPGERTSSSASQSGSGASNDDDLPF
jgi:single-strand DNA-binding protein